MTVRLVSQKRRQRSSQAGQADEVDDASCPGLLIGDELLVVDLEHLDAELRQHGSPVGHHGQVVVVEHAQVPQVLRVARQARRELLEVARQARVQRAPPAVDDLRPRQHPRDDAEVLVVAQQLVADPRGTRSVGPQRVEVCLAERIDVVLVQVAGALGVPLGGPDGLTERLEQAGQDEQLAGPVSLRVRVDDLLDERRAGTRHAHDEHRQRRAVAAERHALPSPRR